MSRQTPRRRNVPPTVTIRTLRYAHGLNIPQLVQRIAEQGVEVTADHISNCELGWKRPSNHLLHAWAKALKIEPVDVTLTETPATGQDLPTPDRVSA